MNAIARLRRLAAALCVAGALCLTPTLCAADAPANKPTEAAFGAAGGTDLSRYKEENVPGGTYLVIAYGVMWALVAAMVARLLMNQARLEARITELEEQLEEPQQ